MSKRIFSVVILLVCAIFFCACVPSEDPILNDPNALTIMGKKSDMEKLYMRKIFDKYREDTGKNIRVIEYADGEYETRAKESFAKGDIPDLFMHFHDADLNGYDVESNFYDLKNEAWVDDITESAMAYCTDAEGRLLGLPFWESSVSGCYYNKTLFKEKGINTGVPTSQQAFDDICAQLLEKGIFPILWPGGCSWMVQFALDPLFATDPAHPDETIYREHLEKLNKNELKFADIPEVGNMIQWIKDAGDKLWFGEGFLNKGWDDISAPLANGEYAMAFIWDTWFYTDFVEGKYKKEDFALMPVFMNTKPTYEGGNLNMMMVNKNGDKLEEALAFLSYCAEPENYNYAFEGISTVKCFEGMTTNIQSTMITDKEGSIKRYERVSTASTKIIAYSANNIEEIINRLLAKEKGMTVENCIRLMDEDRINNARTQGAEGF